MAGNSAGPENPDDVLSPVVERFKVYEQFIRLKRSAGPITEHVFDNSITINEELLAGYFQDVLVAGAIEAYLTGYERDTATLAGLEDNPPDGFSPEDVAILKDVLEKQGETSRHRMALFYKGGAMAVKEVDREDTDERQRAETFLNQEVEVVAKELKGKRLKIGDTTAVIVNTRAQDGAYNASYLKTRPIFGDDPRDAYVGASRGNYMLFIRAGDKQNADSCVTIMAAATDDGANESLPSKVTKEIYRINEEMVGDAYLTDGTLTLELVKRQKKR